VFKISKKQKNKKGSSLILSKFLGSSIFEIKRAAIFSEESYF
jgi:hypothetical protein